jgi:hypothetical protein
MNSSLVMIEHRMLVLWDGGITKPVIRKKNPEMVACVDADRWTLVLAGDVSCLFGPREMDI